jgi:hypothetical protein
MLEQLQKRSLEQPERYFRLDTQETVFQTVFFDPRYTVPDVKNQCSGSGNNLERRQTLKRPGHKPIHLRGQAGLA